MNQVYSYRHRIVSGAHGLRGQGSEGNCVAIDATRRQQDSNGHHDVLTLSRPSFSGESPKRASFHRDDGSWNRSKSFGKDEEHFQRMLDKIQVASEKNPADPQDDERVLDGAQIAAAKIFRNIMDVWKLSNKDMAILLGNDQPDSYEEYIGSLLGGKFSFGGRDTKDRMAQIFQMRRVLCSLFRDDEVENEWLRESHELLDNKSPMDLMLEGSMENLSLVREFVETAAGL